MLPHAIMVMTEWGFDYVSNYCWGKDKIGSGYWNREKHELLLIGTRGKVPCPAPGEQWDSLIQAPRGKHSEKPECFLEMIEQYFPTLPKIELTKWPKRPSEYGGVCSGNRRSKTLAGKRRSGRSSRRASERRYHFPPSDSDRHVALPCEGWLVKATIPRCKRAVFTLEDRGV